jgi:TonB family protein
MKVARLIIMIAIGLVSLNKGVAQTVLDPNEDTSHIHKTHPRRFTPLPLVPQYPGGREAMNEFIKKNTQYPVEAKEHDVKGTVQVDFIMTKKGEITKAHVYKPLGYGCDKEALRVVSLMPKWRPGMMGRDSIQMDYHVDIPFGMDTLTDKH